MPDVEVAVEAVYLSVVAQVDAVVAVVDSVGVVAAVAVKLEVQLEAKRSSLNHIDTKASLLRVEKKICW